MGRALFGIASASACVAATACILSIDPLPDTSSADAGADGTASADGADAAVASILPNGGFEDGTGGGCGATWSAFNALLTRDTTARSGTYSCRVCKHLTSAPDADAFAQPYSIDSLDAMRGIAYEIGQTWQVTAWVRLAPGTASTATSMAVLRVERTNGTPIQFSSPVAATKLTADWQQVGEELQVAQDGGAFLNVYVEADPGNEGDCFLVDDVSVFRTK
jgi:hypothetical protein